jgi:hypothetical protein
MGNVRLIRPEDGYTVEVPAHEAGAFMRQGYVEESAGEGLSRMRQEERSDYYGSADQQVLAGLEGLAAGATVGLSDVLLADDATAARAEADAERYRKSGAITWVEEAHPLAPLHVPAAALEALRGVAPPPRRDAVRTIGGSPAQA